MTGKWTDSDISNLIDHYQAGLSISDAAQHAGMPFGTAAHILKKHSVRRDHATATLLRKKRERDAIRDDVVSSFNDGQSVQSIAKRIGVQRSTITLCLKDVNIRPRNRSESMSARMRNATPTQRKAWAKAANATMRGKPPRESRMEQAARTRERTQSKVGDLEQDIADELFRLGHPVMLQKAIGRYNIDIMVGPLAVEIHITVAGPRGYINRRRRIEYLVNRGVPLLYIWVPTGRPDPASLAQEIIAHIERAKSLPPGAGHYWVIRRPG